jgi:hypothetical protein
MFSLSVYTMYVNDTSIKIIKERRMFIANGGILVVTPFEGSRRFRPRASFDVIVVRFTNHHLAGHLSHFVIA